MNECSDEDLKLWKRISNDPSNGGFINIQAMHSSKLVSLSDVAEYYLNKRVRKDWTISVWDSKTLKGDMWHTTKCKKQI